MNKTYETRPCPTIINKLEIIPILLHWRMKGVNKAMCKIDEQAIKFLMSKNRIIKVEKIRLETQEKEIITLKKFIEILLNIIENLKRPKEPNFNIILARIIEQQPEAET